MILILKVK